MNDCRMYDVTKLNSLNNNVKYIAAATGLHAIINLSGSQQHSD